MVHSVTKTQTRQVTAHTHALGDLAGWDERNGREVQDGGAICIHMADSLFCTAETNISL